MDGERRIAKPVRQNRYFRNDCAFVYRFLARGFAVLFLAAAIVRGVILGGHLDYAGSPWPKLPGKIAGAFGLAAIDIEMAGLRHHEAAEVLSQIGVRPGGSLIGFDAKAARERLQSLDWIESASVVRRFPNQLQVTVAEREPFVIWQNKGRLFVVDRTGTPMSGVPASSGNMMLQVVGEGANTSASNLINQMEATPDLFHDLKAAVRVGDRRWDLFMKDGLTISLPEHGLEASLKLAETTYLTARANQLPVQQLDFRVAGQVIYRASSGDIQFDPTTTSSIQ
jgi:cell division protein FtsQ